MFVVTLTVAGNETTRNSITQGMMAFADYPDQWELFKAQRPKTAADEIIRWASPITAFQRTALADTELGGVKIKKGQRLVLFYRSANFDEDVFDDPYHVRHPARSQPAPRVWRHRRALLRRRQPRADDHRPDVQRDRRPHPRADACRRTGAAAAEHDQRHQALAGRIPMNATLWPAAMVFSILVVVGWLVLGPLVAWCFMRKSNHAFMPAAAPFSQPAAAQSPPVYPSQAPPEQPYADLVGLWHFTSTDRWFGAGLRCRLRRRNAAVAIPENILYAVPPALIALLSLWRPTLAAPACTVYPNLAITLGRGGREIPLDLNHYRYARMHPSQVRYGGNFPSMLVFDRDSPPGFGTLLSSMLFPRVDDGRIVLFYNRWCNAHALIISPNRLDDFFLDACRRAGTSRTSGRRAIHAGRLAWRRSPTERFRRANRR